MTKQEQLKKIIKHLIKECLNEILVEQGLRKVIEEAAQTQPQEPQRTSYIEKERKFINKTVAKQPNKIEEGKKVLLEKIGMGGFDPFAGSVPVEGSEESITESLNPEVNVLPGISGRGVDISSLMGNNKQAWKNITAALDGTKKE
jgi:hypothetical protein